MNQPAPVSLQVHGTSVALVGRGLLLRGPAGSGKSNLALRLIEAGAVLIADDLCQIGRVGGRLVIDLPAAVDAKFRGQIHIRGRGVLSLPYFGPATLGLVADLMPSIPDAPPPDRIEFLGLTVPRILAPTEWTDLVRLMHGLAPAFSLSAPLGRRGRRVARRR